VTLPRPGSHIEIDPRPDIGLEGQVIRKNLLRRLFHKDLGPELIDGRYILKQSIGRGAKGTVFLAKDGRLDRQLAIKLLHEHDSPVERTRLIREGQALAKLRHENVVQVYDAQNYDGQVYLAMEYIAGTTLRAWQREKPRGFRELLDAYRQAGAGLAAAHKAGFVHRDFKPENVLIERATGRVCVVDFGLVKLGGGARPSVTLEDPRALQATPTYQPRACDVRLTATHQAAGTPLYMSKESFFLGHADAKSDQFSFCVSLYLALYDQYPLTGTEPPASYADLVEAVDKGCVHPPPRGSKVPSWVFRVLARGMHADATQRYPSMQALLADLDHGRRYRRVYQSLAGATLILGGLMLGLFVSPPDPCRGTAQEFEQVWNDDTRAGLRHAFAQTAAQDADSRFDRAKDVLDGYAEDWTDTRTEVCQATESRGQVQKVHEQRMACLDARRTEFDFLIAQLRSPSAKDVDNAAWAAAGLPSPNDCASVEAGPVTPNAEQLPKVRDAEAELAKAAVADAFGNYSKALDHTIKAIDLAPPDYRPTLAQAYYQMAEEQVALGQGRAALTSLERGLDVAVPEKLAAMEAQIAALELKVLSLPKLGATDKDRGSYVKAHAERLKEIDGIPLHIAAQFYKSVGLRAQFVDQKYFEALAAYEMAYNLLDSHPGEYRRDIADTLMNMGNTYVDLRELAKAEVYYAKAYQIEVALSGEGHPRLAGHHYNLAVMFYSRREFEKALEHAEKALELDKKVYGDHGLSVAEDYSLIVVLLEELERYPEGLKLADKRRALVLGLPDPGVRMRARAQQGVARMLWKQDKDDEAAEVQAETLSIWSAGGVPQTSADKEEYAASIVLMANIETSRKNYEGADKFYGKAQGILQELKGSDTTMAEVLLGQGRSYEQRGDLQRAHAVLEQALEQCQRSKCSRIDEVQQLLSKVKQASTHSESTNSPLTPGRNE